MLLERIKLLIFKSRVKHRFPESNVIFTRPVDISRVSVGYLSYGRIDMIAFDPEGTSTLSIGDFVSIASIKILLDENHDLSSLSPFPFTSYLANRSMKVDCSSRGNIVIGDHSWIGEDVLILSGVNIGPGSIIAAGSVVIRDVPAGSIVAGVPARVVRQRLSPEDIIDLTSTDYKFAYINNDLNTLKK